MGVAPGSVGDECDATLILVEHVDVDDQVVPRHGAGHRRSPLDQQDTVGGEGEEIEVVPLTGGLQAVDVGVVDREEAVVAADDDEAGAGHRLVDPEAVGHPGGDQRLPGPERAGEQYHVARPEQTGQAAAQGDRLGRERRGDDHAGRCRGWDRGHAAVL